MRIPFNLVDRTWRMFGFERMRTKAEGCPNGETMFADKLKKAVGFFTGEGWEREDDVVVLKLKHLAAGMADPIPLKPSKAVEEEARRLLADFSLSSEAGNELEAMRWVAGIVAGLDLSETQLERLKTAVAETTMNAIEHGNRYQEDFPVNIQVLLSDTKLAVRIADFGADQVTTEYEEPDIDAKLEGKQSPRGWGLFLIKHMVDEINVTTNETLHTVELILNLKVDATQ